MRWDDRLVDLFEDLEQQAEGLHLTERDTELADRSRAEYSSVTFASRIHASVGAQVLLSVAGVGPLTGALTRAGEGWCLLEASASHQEWVVCLHAIRQAGGLSERAVNPVARPVVARLSLRSALRGLAEAHAEVAVHHVDGTHSGGRVSRVGADFVELAPPPDGMRLQAGGTELLPLSLVAAVRRTSG